jgi:hypothetical protein
MADTGITSIADGPQMRYSLSTHAGLSEAR